MIGSWSRSTDREPGMTQDEAKLAVAKRAVEFVEDGMRVGLGTGTTATLFIRELGARVQAGLKIRCVASSDASHKLAQSLGMDVTTLDRSAGARRLHRRRRRGRPGPGPHQGRRRRAAARKDRRQRGAALYRCGRFVQDRRAPGQVSAAGRGGQDGAATGPAEARSAGPLPKQRPAKGGGEGPYLTDEGNYILDCACGEIADPEETAAEIRSIVGVVEHGLFLGHGQSGAGRGRRRRLRKGSLNAVPRAFCLHLTRAKGNPKRS